MARPATKAELVESSAAGYRAITDLMESMTGPERESEFLFEDRDRCCRDVVMHLVEWQTMLLTWVKANTAGHNQPFLPQPHSWRTTPTLNYELWERNQGVSLPEACERLRIGHDAVMELVELFGDDELFTKKHFAWTGSTSLGSACVSATSSHYQWALKKLRRHHRSYQSALPTE